MSSPEYITTPQSRPGHEPPARQQRSSAKTRTILMSTFLSYRDSGRGVTTTITKTMPGGVMHFFARIYFWTGGTGGTGTAPKTKPVLVGRPLLTFFSYLKY